MTGICIHMLYANLPALCGMTSGSLSSGVSPIMAPFTGSPTPPDPPFKPLPLPPPLAVPPPGEPPLILLHPLLCSLTRTESKPPELSGRLSRTFSSWCSGWDKLIGRCGSEGLRIFITSITMRAVRIVTSTMPIMIPSTGVNSMNDGGPAVKYTSLVG